MGWAPVKPPLRCASHVLEHDLVKINRHKESSLDGIPYPLPEPSKY